MNNKKSKRMKKMWDDVTAEMMTEEETGSDISVVVRVGVHRHLMN